MSNEIDELKARLREYEQLVEELSAPIIPSIIPETILVPLMGTLTEQRFQLIQEKVLNTIANDGSDTVLIDFTGINLNDVDRMGLDGLSCQVSQLNSALDVMGVKTVFVGFSPEFVRAIVTAGVDVSRYHVHASFRTALQHVMRDKGLEFNDLR
ncbi:STAS domain-containing protein [Aciduricibacillus chroicocephali]|uniref:STAS domain-containing protein n=1 Tax=Aciduricibacillus chroicocephali TaxID=3054939 RepID=A0ABY9KZ53_9BACI|nr:STAS domain-containing protein [Bacillaceae bacterium 44XB]